MAITPVPTLTDIPPFPALADRAAGTYNSKAFAFGTHMADQFNGEIAAVAANVRNNALEALQSAEAIEEAAASAAIAAENAARDAATAASAPGTNATSTTSMTLGLGTKTFTLAQTGKLFGRSNTITISAPTGDNWMSGPITAFNSSTGEMTVNVTNISGTGTFAAWTVSLSGAAGLTGVVNELRANNIASAATVNLTAATGNLVHITGTTTISAFTLQAGAERQIIADGTFTIVNSSTLLVPGRANITVQPGDAFTVRGDTGLTQITNFERASGLAVKSGAFDLLATAEVTSAVANIDYLNIFNSNYDDYVVSFYGAKTTTTGSPIALRFAVNGIVDSSNTSYGNSNSSQISISPNLLASDALGANISLVMRNVNSNSLKSVSISSVAKATSGTVYNTLITESQYLGNTPASGFSMLAIANSIVAGTIKIYGIKNNF